MTSYEQGDVVLATLPFSDLSGIKNVLRSSSVFHILPLICCSCLSRPKLRIFSLKSLSYRNGKRQVFFFPARSSEGCLPSTEPT